MAAVAGGPRIRAVVAADLKLCQPPLRRGSQCSLQAAEVELDAVDRQHSIDVLDGSS